MLLNAQILIDRLCRLRGKQRLTLAVFACLLLVGIPRKALGFAGEPAASAAKKQPAIKEELTLTNGDRLTGQLLNSTGTEIKFKSDLAGEVTVSWKDVKVLKSNRDFAIVLKGVKDARNSSLVPQGAIRIGEKGIVVSPIPAVRAEAGKHEASPGPKSGATREIPTDDIAFVVDDLSYQNEIHKRIGMRSGWDGHITTGTSMIYSTQNSYLFQVDSALQRSVPTVSWLTPKLRTTLNFTLSAGKTTQPNTIPAITNIYHLDAERDEYFSPRGYYLQALSLDHNYSQGLILQQSYGAGVGVTLSKTPNSEFDVTADLHYESQQFNATAAVSELTLHLIGSNVSEAYSRKWGKFQFDEKILIDPAWNNANALSASGNSSLRLPIYKKLGFSVSTIDSYLNNPQVGYKKNSFQVSTGLVFNLH